MLHTPLKVARTLARQLARHAHSGEEEWVMVVHAAILVPDMKDGVAQILAVIKALLDMGYKVTCTMVRLEMNLHTHRPCWSS